MLDAERLSEKLSVGQELNCQILMTIFQPMALPFKTSFYHRLRDSKFGRVEVRVWSQRRRQKINKQQVNHELCLARGHTVNNKNRFDRSSLPDNNFDLNFLGLQLWVQL